MMDAMKYLFAALIFTLISSAAVQAYSCGGLLEGDAGELQFLIEGNADGNGIRFTLTRLGSAGVVSVFPEHESTETVLTPIRLDASSVNSTVLTTGQVLIVTLAKSSSSSVVSFTWEADAPDSSGSVRAASYVDTPEGRVSWTKFGQQERLTWGLDVDPSNTLEVRASTDFGRCNLLNPCQCTYFALYEVTPDGYLREAARVCGRPSEANIENLYSQLVAFVYVNTTGAEDPTASVELTWVASSSEETTTTSTTTTAAPPGVQLQCGVIITVPPEGITVDYKLGEEYDNKEFCVWNINSTGDGWNFMEVTIESQGFEANEDGIDGYYVSTAGTYLPSLSKCNFSVDGQCVT